MKAEVKQFDWIVSEVLFPALSKEVGDAFMVKVSQDQLEANPDSTETLMYKMFGGVFGDMGPKHGKRAVDIVAAIKVLNEAGRNE